MSNDDRMLPEGFAERLVNLDVVSEEEIAKSDAAVKAFKKDMEKKGWEIQHVKIAIPTGEFPGPLHVHPGESFEKQLTCPCKPTEEILDSGTLLITHQKRG